MRKEYIERSIAGLAEELRNALLLSTEHTYEESSRILGIQVDLLVVRIREARRRVVVELLGEEWRDAESQYVIDIQIDAAAMRMQRRLNPEGVARRVYKWLKRRARETTAALLAVMGRPLPVHDAGDADIAATSMHRYTAHLRSSFRPVVVAVAAAVVVAGSVWMWQRYEAYNGELLGVAFSERRILSDGIAPRWLFRWGNRYAHGRGVPQSDAAAARWYRVAAEQNYRRAQIEVARLYLEGRGVAQNDVLAYMWMQIAGLEQEQDSLELVARMSGWAVVHARWYAWQWRNEFMRQDQPIVAAGTLFTLGDSRLPGAGSASDSRHLLENVNALIHGALADALTFHASFDNGLDADRAAGDPVIYTAPSYDEQDQAEPALGNPAGMLAEGAGRFGHALRFTEGNQHSIFYRAEGNVGYSPDDWSGTVSFWLSVDPATDLEPGFCDPIQITDAAYDDAGIWVDFTAENPRQFRLGVFGDFDVWNPDGLGPRDNPAFTDRLAVVDEPPFAGGRWTHVAITYAGLGQPGGTATLYLDGERVPGGADDIDEPFTWDVELGAIRLGVNCVGFFDELSLFDRALLDHEVRILHTLDGGVAALSMD